MQGVELTRSLAQARGRAGQVIAQLGEPLARAPAPVRGRGGSALQRRAGSTQGRLGRGQGGSQRFKLGSQVVLVVGGQPVNRGARLGDQAVHTCVPSFGIRDLGVQLGGGGAQPVRNLGQPVGGRLQAVQRGLGDGRARQRLERRLDGREAGGLRVQHGCLRTQRRGRVRRARRSVRVHALDGTRQGGQRGL